MRSLYSPKASRIFRVLLNDPRRPWKLQTLADEAEVSLGQAHKVKSLLADREQLRQDTEGILLSNPSELLAEWVSSYSHRKNETHLHYIPETPGKTEENLTAVCLRLGIRHALAAFSAHALCALRPLSTRLCLRAGRANRGSGPSLQLKEAPTGTNLVLWIPSTMGSGTEQEVCRRPSDFRYPDIP